MAVLYSNPDLPNEIYFSNNNKFTRVTHIQDSYLAPLRKIYKKGFSAVASDKNIVSGILYLLTAQRNSYHLYFSSMEVL